MVAFKILNFLDGRQESQDWEGMGESVRGTVSVL